jgi:molybdopterin converting factor subunit 1
VRVTVRLFAMLRERAGAGEVALDLPDGARVTDAIAELGEVTAGIPLVMAVNREYARDDRVLDPGDELALIPPVSGGEGKAGAGAGQAAGPEAPEAGADRAAARRTRAHARVVAEPLSPEAVSAGVRDPRAGAIVTFQGVTREVERLDYEAYVAMAEERIAAIAAEAVARHGLCAAACEHRVGGVPLSEPSVVVACSAPHRSEAFAGAREIIDRVKAEAPIWKREVEGGEARWVDGVRPTG